MKSNSAKILLIDRSSRKEQKRRKSGCINSPASPIHTKKTDTNLIAVVVVMDGCVVGAIIEVFVAVVAV